MNHCYHGAYAHNTAFQIQEEYVGVGCAAQIKKQKSQKYTVELVLD